MGYPTGYTLGLFKKEPENQQEQEEQEEQETVRCAAIGNSFHAVTLACLIDLWLWSAEVRTDPIGAKEIIRQWHLEMTEKVYGDFGGLLVSEGPGQPVSSAEEPGMAQPKCCIP